MWFISSVPPQELHNNYEGGTGSHNIGSAVCLLLALHFYKALLGGNRPKQN